jgi:DNA-binding PadR family transcriptional regulator
MWRFGRGRCGSSSWGRAWAYAYAPGQCGPGFESSHPGTQGPFMNRGWWQWGGPGGSRFFEGGEARLAILSLLGEAPKHGYQLMKEMKERSGGMYRASAGTIYPTLQMLEDEGLIEALQQEGKRVYRLTETGRAELARDPEAVRRIWERAEHWEDWSQYRGPEVLAFLTPLRALAKAVLRSTKWASGSVERDAKLRELIQKVTREFEDLAK